MKLKITKLRLGLPAVGTGKTYMRLNLTKLNSKKPAPKCQVLNSFYLLLNPFLAINHSATSKLGTNPSQAISRY
jgi:hypothetical protein